MDNLRRIGNSISIPIQPDEHGLTGRECPKADCEGYFKVQFGTGIKGENVPCHCPYCGHSALHDQFWTKEQIEYAQSVAMREITDAFHKDLKKLEFEHRPRGAFGIGISLKVKPGSPTPIRHYREKSLETDVVCDQCTLRYAIYGVFAFCPDCGRHNSTQILEKNLEVITKLLSLAAQQDAEVARSMREDALENVVSAFDGFGREACRVHAKKASVPEKTESLSFQNLDGARNRLRDLFGFDLADAFDPNDWMFTSRCFQKRHVLAHKMGVIDEEYVAKANDPSARVGRRVVISGEEVAKLAEFVRRLGQFMIAQLDANPKSRNVNV